MKSRSLIAVAALSALALPAFAAGDDIQYRSAGYASDLLPYTTETSTPAPASRATAERAAPAIAAKGADGFQFVGGETGWALVPHIFVWRDGRFAHSDECDHAVRVAQVPTPAEVDAARNLSPGA